MLLKAKGFVLSVILFSFSLSFFILIPTKAEAIVGVGFSPAVKLYGTAWSSNIGWISFNNCELESEGGETCSGPSYYVSVNESTGAMTGTAWSSNIGWIKFGELSQFPVGNGTISANAQITFSGPSAGAVTGWARACGGTLGGDCSSMSPQTDGWDGWISLSGANHLSPEPDGSLGVTYIEATDRLVGKAWGGTVIGWINFTDVRYGVASEQEPLDYNLTNSSPDFELEIPQGNIGSVSVQRVYVEGSAEQISISADTISPPAGSIDISIVANNPCLVPPDCSSSLQIDVSNDVPLGQYSFVVTGVSNLSGVERETTIRFEVTDGNNPPPPKISCEASGDLWTFGTVTWTAEIAEGQALGGETFYWGYEVTCEGQPSEECYTVNKKYTTPGLKLAVVKVSDSEGVYFGEAVCFAPVGVKVFFKEF